MGFIGSDICLKKVKEDEPIFVLRAQDFHAPEIVRQWAAAARATGCPEPKVQEAIELAGLMEKWAAENGGKYPD